jgi:aspartate-semialdehyde dehydrogenase
MPQPKLAIVGSESLLGREVRGLLPEAGFTADVKLIGADEETGIITERDGEPVLISELTPGSLAGLQIAFLTGSAASAARAVHIASTLTPAPHLIDLTYGSEGAAGASLRAPAVEAPGYQAPASAVYAVAHPAAISLVLFLSRLEHLYPVRRAVVHVFEPASERGQRGLDELQKQTVNLFSFRPLPKEVFDAQLGFNMLAKLGSEAQQQLHEIELRIRNHVAALQAAAGRKTIPSIRLIQAPVFHGHSFSIWVKFQKAPGVRDLESSLAGPDIDIRDQDMEAPTNAGIAGQSGIAVGAIAPDPAEPNAVWFWAVADNFRIMAENAIAVARSLLPKTAGGTK